ncbi:hypothetical protein FEM48_Zijuj06G0202800 [Ziziphus jujuba var. spinosa]|uniref:Protein SCAI-like n=1 Tax=Ziziphus jujuba var. spinosa TaxID=714518 RepID=A0A978VBE3_ZIZJJ|nr:hypothetical protein FEM48_Zijuj06G0202800 [Ziziphus jujuba var. spinosa]
MSLINDLLRKLVSGINCIYPSDLVPFTRRPLFLVIDSDSSEAFEASCSGFNCEQAINGAEKGETAAMLLSPSTSYCSTTSDSSHHQSGSLFTIFLTAPLQAFCLLLGISGSDVEMVRTVNPSLSSGLAYTETLDPVWAQIFGDPFLRRILLRFVFCLTVFTLYAPTFNKKEFVPKCLPGLPVSVLPTNAKCQNLVRQIADIFGASSSFIFSEGHELDENRHGDTDSMSLS